MTAWTSVLQYAKGMSDWFTTQDARLKEMGTKQPEVRGAVDRTAETQGGTANPQYWQEKIHPQSNQYAEESFNRELVPWEKRLAEKGFRISKLEKTALMQSFVGGVSRLASQNQDYKTQMGRYKRMKSPDAGAVMSVFRSEFNCHASNVMKSLVEDNWGDKLKGGKPGPKPGVKESVKASVAPQSGVKLVSMKPRRDDIDFPRTPSDWIYQNKWRMKNGEVHQYRP